VTETKASFVSTVKVDARQARGNWPCGPVLFLMDAEALIFSPGHPAGMATAACLPLPFTVETKLAFVSAPPTILFMV
jgi:hypothetical protein